MTRHYARLICCLVFLSLCCAGCDNSKKYGALLDDYENCCNQLAEHAKLPMRSKKFVDRILEKADYDAATLEKGQLLDAQKIQFEALKKKLNVYR